MTKLSKKFLCVGLMSVVLSSSLYAAGIGKVYTSQTPEEETREWRQAVLSTLKNISVSCEERVRFEDEKTEVFRLLLKHFSLKKQAETPTSD